jgi:hypothetical protein
MSKRVVGIAALAALVCTGALAQAPASRTLKRSAAAAGKKGGQ